MKPLADLLVFIGVCAMLTGSIPPEFEAVFIRRHREMLA